MLSIFWSLAPLLLLILVPLPRMPLPSFFFLLISCLSILHIPLKVQLSQSFRPRRSQCSGPLQMVSHWSPTTTNILGQGSCFPVLPTGFREGLKKCLLAATGWCQAGILRPPGSKLRGNLRDQRKLLPKDARMETEPPRGAH